MAPSPLLTAEECEVDVVVLGTGLTESLAAAGLARAGQKVLHLDSDAAYGGNWRALSVADLEAWASTTEEEPEEAAEPPDLGGLRAVPLARAPSCFRERRLDWDPAGARSPEALEELQQGLRKRASAWSLDLVPRLFFGRSEAVDVLVESGVARYLEFQGLRSSRVLGAEGLASVPLTKSEIFQDGTLTLPEKRMLMRFITSMSPFVGSLAFESPAQLGVDVARKVPAPAEPAALPGPLAGLDLEMPWQGFLQGQRLSWRLQELLTYAICLWDWELKEGGGGLTAREGLQRLGSFVSSLGIHGRGTSMPLLYPMYGVAEVAQGFTRMCALHNGVYALRTSVTAVLAEEGEEPGAWRAAGLVTHRGEVVRAKTVLSSCDHLLQEGAPEPPATQVACRRIIAVTEVPLLGEEGLSLCVVPPGAFSPALGNVVQALQLDQSTGSCPKGFHVLHLSQALRAPGGDAGADNGDLGRVLDRLLGLAGAGLVLRCSYLQLPRATARWDAATAEGAVLAACGSSRTLLLTPDPAAVPQLLSEDEVPRAREAFMANGLFAPEDFLRKPAHVAAEEQAGALEELEAFTSAMPAPDGDLGAGGSAAPEQLPQASVAAAPATEPAEEPAAAAPAAPEEAPAAAPPPPAPSAPEGGAEAGAGGEAVSGGDAAGGGLGGR